MKKIITTATLVASIAALSACSSFSSTGPGYAGGRTAGNDTGVEYAATKAAPVKAKAEKVFKAQVSK